MHDRPGAASIAIVLRMEAMRKHPLLRITRMIDSVPDGQPALHTEMRDPRELADGDQHRHAVGLGPPVTGGARPNSAAACRSWRFPFVVVLNCHDKEEPNAIRPVDL